MTNYVWTWKWFGSLWRDGTSSRKRVLSGNWYNFLQKLTASFSSLDFLAKKNFCLQCNYGFKEIVLCVSLTLSINKFPCIIRQTENVWLKYFTKVYDCKELLDCQPFLLKEEWIEDFRIWYSTLKYIPRTRSSDEYILKSSSNRNGEVLFMLWFMAGSSQVFHILQFREEQNILVIRQKQFWKLDLKPKTLRILCFMVEPLLTSLLRSFSNGALFLVL
jgi:hypothetical protein